MLQIKINLWNLHIGEEILNFDKLNDLIFSDLVWLINVVSKNVIPKSINKIKNNLIKEFEKKRNNRFSVSREKPKEFKISIGVCDVRSSVCFTALRINGKNNINQANFFLILAADFFETYG